MKLKDLKISNKDYPYLLFLIVFSTILISYYILFNIKLGIYCSDVYVYLSNSLMFTGIDLNNSKTLYLGPLICFLTSLLINIGIKGEIVIFIITGIFAIIGNIGLYILLKTRFNKPLSLTGTITYSCLSLNLLWLANGTLDIPAVAITIWIVLFTILAIEKNPKYYPIAFTLFIIGILVRYTVGFILPILFVYFVYKTKFKLDNESKKYIKRSIIATIGITITFIIIMYILNPGNLKFLEIIFNAMHGSKGDINDSAYTLDTWFYLKNFLQYISCNHIYFTGMIPHMENATPLSYGIIAILVSGAILSINNLKKIKIKNKKITIAAISLAIIICATFTHIIGLLSIILTIGLLIIIHYLLKDSEFENLDLNILFLTWFLVYFMYFTYFNSKVDRYIITVMPAVIYFIICALNKIESKLNKTRIKNILPIILIGLFIINAIVLPLTIECDTDFHKNEEVATYIKDIDPNYKNETIGSYNQRPYLWYFQQPIKPITMNNIEIIDNSNITYYISGKSINLTNYEEIHEIKGIHIYKEKITRK